MLLVMVNRECSGTVTLGVLPLSALDDLMNAYDLDDKTYVDFMWLMHTVGEDEVAGVLRLWFGETEDEQITTTRVMGSLHADLEQIALVWVQDQILDLSPYIVEVTVTTYFVPPPAPA